MAPRRTRWRAHQHRFDPARLVFVDGSRHCLERGHNMTRSRGWSPRATPLLAKVPHGHWRTLTFLAGLRHERILAPTLTRGDIVIADKLGSHKGRPVRAELRAVGAKLFFLPAYSPDLNPIEMVFAKLKTLLRKADERSVEATWRRIGDLPGAFTSKECAACLRHAGYDPAMA